MWAKSFHRGSGVFIKRFCKKRGKEKGEGIKGTWWKGTNTKRQSLKIYNYKIRLINRTPLFTHSNPWHKNSTTKKRASPHTTAATTRTSPTNQSKPVFPANKSTSSGKNMTQSSPRSPTASTRNKSSSKSIPLSIVSRKSLKQKKLGRKGRWLEKRRGGGIVGRTISSKKARIRMLRKIRSRVIRSKSKYRGGKIGCRLCIGRGKIHNWMISCPFLRKVIKDNSTSQNSIH